MPIGNVPIEQGLTAEAPALLEALSSMGDTGNLGDVMLALIANSGGGDEAKANALLGSGKALGVNQSVGIGDREAVRGANAENSLARAMGVVGAQQAGALDRTNAQQAGTMDRLVYTTERKPVSVSAGATAFLPPAHPLAGEGPLRGAPTKSTVQGGLLGEHFEDLMGLESEQQKALGAYIDPSSAGTPRNYLTAEGRQGITLDGMSDAATGEPIPQGSTVFTGQVQPDDVSGLTTATRTGVQQQGIALNEFSDMLGELREVAGSDPTVFGVAGNVRRGAQALGQQAQNLGLLLGRDFDQELGEAAAAFGGTVDPNAFDPNLTDIQKLATLTAYKAAAALAAQSGRGLSDKDFQNFRQVIGDPTSWTASQPAFMAGLNRVERMVAQNLTRNQALQSGQPAPAAPGAPETPAQAPPAASPSSPSSDVEEILKRYGL